MMLNDQNFEPLASAAFEQSFNSSRPDALGGLSEGVSAASIVAFIESPSPEWGSGFFFFAVGSRQAIDASRRQSPNAIAQAFAASARAALYGAGFKPPANPMNDYPSATFLLGRDLACSQIALSAPADWDRKKALERAQGALAERAGSMFGVLMAISRPAMPELRHHRAFDALANEAISRLRQALAIAPEEPL